MSRGLPNRQYVLGELKFRCKFLATKIFLHCDDAHLSKMMKI